MTQGVVRVNGGIVAPAYTTGRTLRGITLGVSGIHTGYGAVDSDLEKIIRAISTVATVELIGTPASNKANVFISGNDTIGLNSGGSTATLESLANAAVSGATVTAFTF
jgi:hypothetical protein